MSGRAVADALGVSYSTLCRAVAADASPIPFLKVNARIVFPTASVRAALHLDDGASNGNGAAPIHKGGTAITDDHDGGPRREQSP